MVTPVGMSKDRSSRLRAERSLWAIPFGLFAALLSSLFGAMIFQSLFIHSGTRSGWTLSFAAYLDVIHTPVYWNVFRNSLVIGATGASLVTAFAIALVAAFAGGSASFQRRVLLAILVPPLIPLLARIIGWLMVLQDDGLLHWALPRFGPLIGHLLYSRAGLLLGLTHSFISIGFLLIWASYHSINPRQIEAGRTLGASPLQTWFRVIIPQLLPGIITSWLLVFLLSLGAYVSPTLLGGSKELMIYSVIETRLNQQMDIPTACAYGVLLTIGVATILLIAERVVGISSSLQSRS